MFLSLENIFFVCFCTIMRSQNDKRWIFSEKSCLNKNNHRKKTWEIVKNAAWNVFFLNQTKSPSKNLQFETNPRVLAQSV